MASTAQTFDNDDRSPFGTREEKPHGPLNVDPGIGMSPADDIASPEADEYIDGFSWRTVIGALFIGFIMLPGAIYLGLVAGQGMGPAAEWVTIILFMEVARRSYQTLKKQEIYLLYYIGAGLASQSAGLALSGGAFAGLIWNQYLLQTPMAEQFGVAQQVPNWVWPGMGSEALLSRSFIHKEWLPAIGLLIFGQIFGRLNSFGLGYALYRITSDIERLPFPLAPIAAEGATALAESSAQKEGWRWRIFSIGAMIGVGWGSIYVLLPTVTGLILAKPIVIVSNPFIDFTSNTQKILPGALTAIGTDLGGILVGFVLPLPIVIGTFISAIGAHIVANPILQKQGILKNWTMGLDVTQTQVANYFDFWLSFGIGIALVVAAFGIGSVIRAFIKGNQGKGGGGPNIRMTPPPGRGDVPIWMALAVWVVGTLAYVGICHVLVKDFPIWIMVFFGFVWTPIFSYINARMAGMAGSHLSIPFVREASFMLAGYQRYDIWFAPIPLGDYSGMATQFRILELTRTKFLSIVKAELLMLPIALFCSFLFWSFIWKLAPIPSANYPFAAKMWPIGSQQQILWFTANKQGAGNFVLKAVEPLYIGAGAVVAVVVYAVCALAGLPQLLFYGIANGLLGAQPAGAIPMMIGGMLGRFYFQKRYGVENWRAYTPVLVAGYYCGMGLIGMAAVAIALLSKSVSRLPY